MLEKWQVKIFRVLSRTEQLQPKYAGQSAEHYDNLSIEADGHDHAKREAARRLTEQGYKVRSVNHSAQVERLILVYVETKA